uniref:HAT C-terminal dimerisation domain-containing protein n=1 Tax=Zea mays TaxID=4577 RepID=A0A804UAZ9_MAIZE
MLARRIVSQWLSSSGCERNWSTFALVHAKLRNRLGYEKLHKLIYVHYNFKLHIQYFENDMQSLQEMQVFKDTELDPYSVMIDVAMYDEVLMDELGMDGEVTTLKRKLDFNTRDGKNKRKAGLVDIEDDVESDSSEGSPIHVELCDSSSDDGTGDEFGDEWEFGGPSGGGACDVGASGDGSRDGVMHEQAAPNPPLRPRSTRLKKVHVKELYKEQCLDQKGEAVDLHTYIEAAKYAFAASYFVI